MGVLKKKNITSEDVTMPKHCRAMEMFSQLLETVRFCLLLVDKHPETGEKSNESLEERRVGE